MDTDLMLSAIESRLVWWDWPVSPGDCAACRRRTQHDPESPNRTDLACSRNPTTLRPWEFGRVQFRSERIAIESSKFREWKLAFALHPVETSTQVTDVVGNLTNTVFADYYTSGQRRGKQ